jgi:uncharacterized membrane protein YqiK
MPSWLLILILILVAVGSVVLFIAMFTEMGTKRKTGTMGNKRSGRGGTKSRKKRK